MAGLVGRLPRFILVLAAGVALFIALSIFASDPSPEKEAAPVVRSCGNDWRKCANDDELLKNWNYEIRKPSQAP
jgi:hypothetical protein